MSHFGKPRNVTIWDSAITGVTTSMTTPRFGAPGMRLLGFFFSWNPNGTSLDTFLLQADNGEGTFGSIFTHANASVTVTLGASSSNRFQYVGPVGSSAYSSAQGWAMPATMQCLITTITPTTTASLVVRAVLMDS